jgi:hypothetical protein
MVGNASIRMSAPNRKLRGRSSSVNDCHDRKVDDHCTNDDDRSSTNPQNQVVPELLFKFLLLLFKLNPVGPDLAAHVAELGVAIHPTKATFKVAERSVQELMADVFFHLHQLMLCLKSVKRFLHIVGRDLSFAKTWAF